jgi:hypothetical protein
MLQTPKGGFEYLVSPFDTEVEESISLATIVRARILDLYQKESKPLILSLSPMAQKSLAIARLAIFDVLPVVILDWYHLCKKVRNLMSMIAFKRRKIYSYQISTLTIMAWPD